VSTGLGCAPTSGWFWGPGFGPLLTPMFLALLPSFSATGGTTPGALFLVPPNAAVAALLPGTTVVVPATSLHGASLTIPRCYRLWGCKAAAVFFAGNEDQLL
jgi:hypothetical protein